MSHCLYGVQICNFSWIGTVILWLTNLELNYKPVKIFQSFEEIRGLTGVRVQRSMWQWTNLLFTATLGGELLHFRYKNLKTITGVAYFSQIIHATMLRLKRKPSKYDLKWKHTGVDVRFDCMTGYCAYTVRKPHWLTEVITLAQDQLLSLLVGFWPQCLADWVISWLVGCLRQTAWYMTGLASAAINGLAEQLRPLITPPQRAAEVNKRTLLLG